MRFVVDETSWLFDGRDPAQAIEAVEEVLDRIDDAQEDDHECFYSEELFHLEVWKGLSFYQLYEAGGDLTISRELQLRVAVVFARLQTWQDAVAEWPRELDVEVSDGPVQYAPSIAWAHCQCRLGPAFSAGCITHKARPAGELTVRVAGIERTVWFVASLRDYEQFFRWVIATGTNTPAEMSALACSAFKNLEFVNGCFEGIKRMSKTYPVLAPRLVGHLGALSDEGKRIFEGPRDRVSAEFGPFGVDISDENGGTKSNGKAREERTIALHGERLVFWWHTKLERHQDRIHICPDRVPRGGNIIVGIFCKHLLV